MTVASGTGARARRRDAAHRRDLAWIAALVHRLSGLALAIFLPMHFLVLALAINGAAALDGFLQWTHQPVVKLAESALVALLVVHLLGGLRLLMIEFLPWRGGQKALTIASLALSVVAGVWFLVQAL
jgi:fumarate reductase subunit D